MSTLTRNDGVEFVIQAYREFITDGNKTVTAQKVRQLAEQHGRFVRLFKKPNGEYEGVFSNDAGYLLGESVKHYFHQAQNLIFCEDMGDNHHVILVVIRNGEVYLDTTIATQNVAKELRLLISDPYQYQIFTHGKIPLALDPILPPEKIIGFEKLSNALFPRLPALKNLQVTPLPVALKSQHLNGNGRAITYISISLIALAGGWMLYNVTNDIESRSVTTVAPVNPYLGFDSALRSAEPHQQLIEMMNVIEMLYTIPGWNAKSIDFTQQQYRIYLINDGGDLTHLNDWTTAAKFNNNSALNDYILSKASQIPPRANPKTISNDQLLSEQIHDALANLLGPGSTVIDSTEIVGAAKKTTLTISLQSCTPKLLDIIGGILQNQAVVINSAHFELNGLIMNGQIQLTVWGSSR